MKLKFDLKRLAMYIKAINYLNDVWSLEYDKNCENHILMVLSEKTFFALCEIQLKTNNKQTHYINNCASLFNIKNEVTNEQKQTLKDSIKYVNDFIINY